MSKPSASTKKAYNRYLKGLTTTYEKTLTPNYHKSNITDKSTRVPTDNSQRTFATIDCEDDEFGSDDLFDSIFINVEEEQRIHALLQLAREGKITPFNAFQVPLTVLTPQLNEGTLRFWKFASQLLRTSTCIYDKRMQNFSAGVHQLFSSFVRSNCGQQEREVQEGIYQRSRRKKAELMRLQMTEMSQNADVSLKQIANLNLQEVHKLNNKSNPFQFMITPLFQRTLQSFDSNSLKTLFLNVFELSTQGQLNFFPNKMQCKVQLEKIQLKESFDHEEEQYFPQFVEVQLNKLDFIGRNRQIYSHISQYLQQNSLKNDDFTNRIDLSHEIQNFKSKQGEITFEAIDDDQRTELSSSQIDKFSFHYIQGLQKSLTLSDSQQSQISLYPVSQQCSKDFLIIEAEDWTVIDPRILDFRGTKPKKKRENGSKSQIIKLEKKSKQWLIQFKEQEAQQIRAEIIKNMHIDDKQQNVPFQDKFLMPKSMDIFIEIHRKRRKQLRESLKVQYMSSRKIQNIYQTDAPLSNRNDLTLIDYSQENTQMSVSFRLQQAISTEGLKNLKTFGLRSIRQIKEQIKKKTQRENRFKLSKLCLPISAASTFIVLLHLVNENQLTVHSINEQKDVQILKS